jgi:hypothetical protein
MPTTAHMEGESSCSLQIDTHLLFTQKYLQIFGRARQQTHKRAQKRRKREIDNTFSYQQFNKKAEKKKVSPRQKRHNTSLAFF